MKSFKTQERLLKFILNLEDVSVDKVEMDKVRGICSLFKTRRVGMFVYPKGPKDPIIRYLGLG